MPKLKSGHVSPTVAENAAINAAIRHDPDTREMTARDFARARLGASFSPSDGKTRITMWVDSDVLDAFKELAGKGGKGYQTLINETLRDVVSGLASGRDAQGNPAPATLGFDEERLRQVLREELARQREAFIGQIHDPRE